MAIYIYIIIIIFSCRRHGYPRPSLAAPPYRSSLLAGPQGYIPYPHGAALRRFELVALLLLGHVRGTSLMSSSLLLQQCPACLACLTLIVFVMGGWWPYSCCFVECCLQDLFKIARSILVQLPSSFFFIRLVHPQSSIETTAAWMKLRFILSVRSDLVLVFFFLVPENEPQNEINAFRCSV